MILELLGKIANTVLDHVVGPVPAPPPLEVAPAPEPEPAPEPRQIAFEMRALAARLYQEADRLDPLVWPVPLPTLPLHWNRILDVLGESGGIVKRSDLAAKAKKTRDPYSPECERSKELLKKLEGLLTPIDTSLPCCGEDCGKECCCDTFDPQPAGAPCPACCAEQTSESKDLEDGAKLAQDIADTLSRRWGRKVTVESVESHEPLSGDPIAGLKATLENIEKKL